MSIDVYAPGEPSPYSADQLNALCLPEAGITPGDFLGRADSYGIFYADGKNLKGVAFCDVRYGGMYVYVLCVSENARRGGIGRKILEKVDELARHLKQSIVKLSAIAIQVEFYKNIGFVNKGPEDEDGEYFLMERPVPPVGARRKKTRRNRKSRRRTLSRS
jgi:GNAT superfamily N-acetyltransferase